LEPTATLYDVVKCIRADEAIHREVNHTFADMKADEQSYIDHHVEKKIDIGAFADTKADQQSDVDN